MRRYHYIFMCLILCVCLLCSCGPSGFVSILGALVASKDKIVGEKHTLTIKSAYGKPTLSAGSHEYKDGKQIIVSCGTTPYVDPENPGAKYTYTGFTAKGSALPESGTDESLTFNIKENTTIEWRWNAEYQLSIVSEHGSPTGAGWYESGAQISSSVASLITEEGVQHISLGWTGTGAAPASGAANSTGKFTMNKPATVTWNWQTQHELTISSLYGAPLGAGWHDEDATVSCSVTSPESGGEGVRYVCTGWTGTGSVPETGDTASTGDWIISEPSSVTFNWKTQYRLTAGPDDYGDPQGTGWYDEGTTVLSSVTSSIPVEEGIRYFCIGWTGTGSAPETGTDAETGDFTINEASSVTWIWQYQYLLTITSEYGDPQGEGWHKTETNVEWSVTTPWDSDTEGVRYAADTGAGSILLDEPKEISINWRIQYQLIIDSPYGSPVGGGWYDEDATANWSVTNPSEGIDGIRHTTNIESGSVVLNQPQTVTVNWTGTQYYLTIDSAYGSPIGGGWYNEGDTATWSVTNPSEGIGGVRYITDVASGSEVMNQPKTITVDWTTPQYYLTINSQYGERIGEGWHNADTTVDWSVTSPVSGGWGVQYIADISSGTEVMNQPKAITVNWSTQYQLTIDTEYGAPVGGIWYNVGDTAQWSVTSPYSEVEGIRYIADITSGSEIMNQPKIVTVNWDTEYFLNIESEYGSPVGEGWYEPDSIATWSVTSPTAGETGIRYIADYASGSEIMDGPKTVTISWVTQYRLVINSSYGTPFIGEGWYEEGSTATWRVTSPYNAGSGVRYVADKSTGDVLMDSPKTINVNWPTTQYYLTISSTYGTPIGQGWYTEGVTANWSVNSPVNGGTGVQYVASSSSGSILMDGAKRITVNWTTQYYLTINPSYGLPVGGGWHNTGTTATWSVTSPYDAGSGTIYTTTQTTGNVLMNGPKTVNVEWVTHYLLKVYAEPSSGGTVGLSPTSVDGYYIVGTSVTLAANSTIGFVFEEWSGDLTGKTNPEVVIMDKPRTITANFAGLPIPNFIASKTFGVGSLSTTFADTSEGSIVI
ncbi:MAG: hypothetical protein ABIH42_01150, partial [Planctomycetota bacterium]